jgi:hypothetical protein
VARSTHITARATQRGQWLIPIEPAAQKDPPWQSLAISGWLTERLLE